MRFIIDIDISYDGDEDDSTEDKQEMIEDILRDYNMSARIKSMVEVTE